jgi:hypothetical protein
MKTDTSLQANHNTSLLLRTVQYSTVRRHGSFLDLFFGFHLFRSTIYSTLTPPPDLEDLGGQKELPYMHCTARVVHLRYTSLVTIHAEEVRRGSFR